MTKNAKNRLIIRLFREKNQNTILLAKNHRKKKHKAGIFKGRRQMDLHLNNRRKICAD